MNISRATLSPSLAFKSIYTSSCLPMAMGKVYSLPSTSMVALRTLSTALAVEVLSTRASRIIPIKRTLSAPPFDFFKLTHTLGFITRHCRSLVPFSIPLNRHLLLHKLMVIPHVIDAFGVRLGAVRPHQTLLLALGGDGLTKYAVIVGFKGFGDVSHYEYTHHKQLSSLQKIIA